MAKSKKTSVVAINKKTTKEKLPLLLDIGCGKNKINDGRKWTGVDIIKFPGVDKVFNAGKQKWPFGDGTVDQIHASHFLEHLTPQERMHFFNEAFRVLKNPTIGEAGNVTNGIMSIITPHWCSQRAYGDFTHQWPPVSEFMYLYLNKGWREVNAPHLCHILKCDFMSNVQNQVNPALQDRNPEFVQDAVSWKKEAISDLIVYLAKKVTPKGSNKNTYGISG